MCMRAWPLLFLLVAGLTGPAGYACTCSGRRSFCEQPPASAESKDSAVFIGTVIHEMPTREQALQTLRPRDDLDALIRYWSGVMTDAEAQAIRAGGKDSGLGGIFRYTRQRIRLRVDEQFVGVPVQTFELLSGAGECCDCSVGFLQGEQYLVIANRVESRWTTSGCSGTATVKSAGGEVEALRAWKQGRPHKPSLMGVVFDQTRRPGQRPGEAHMADGIRVVLSGGGMEKEARSDSSGAFAFAGLDKAKYQLRLDAPGWEGEFDWNPMVQTIDFTVKSCELPYFSIKQSQAAIRGRLVGGQDRPVDRVGVKAVPAREAGEDSKYRLWPAKTTGEFSIKELEPGEYVVGINIGAWPVSAKSGMSPGVPHSPYLTYYYPGVTSRQSAQVFRVERGQQIDLADWAAPAPAVERRFEGVVLSQNGAPASGARVFLGAPGKLGRYYQRSEPTGVDGRFVVWGFRGLAYRVLAAVRGPGGRDSAWVELETIGEADQAITVKLDQSGQLPYIGLFDEFSQPPFARPRAPK